MDHKNFYKLLEKHRKSFKEKLEIVIKPSINIIKTFFY